MVVLVRSFESFTGICSLPFSNFFFLNCAEELKMKRKKQLKKDTASKIKSLVDEVMDLFFAEVF